MVKLLQVNVHGKPRLLGVKEAARELGVSRQFIHGVATGRPGYKSKRVEAWLRKHLVRVP